MDKETLSKQFYIEITQVPEALESIGVGVDIDQVKRACEPDAHGKRKLPAFLDPIKKKLMVNKFRLFEIYQHLEAEAEKNLREPIP